MKMNFQYRNYNPGNFEFVNAFLIKDEVNNTVEFENKNELINWLNNNFHNCKLIDPDTGEIYFLKIDGAIKHIVPEWQ